MEKKRSVAITWLKFLAAFLIINSHCEALYPGKLSILSFGGLFGNMLFFLVSGYCLTNIRQGILPWFTKRAIRIYVPYLLLLPLLLNMGKYSAYPAWYILFPIEPYHFLPTILTLYPLYYLVSWLNQKGKFKYIHALVLTCVAQLIFFYTLYDRENGSLVAHYEFMGVSSYFVAMLLGGLIKQMKRPVKPLPYLLIGAIAFLGYGLITVRPLPPIIGIAQMYIALVFVYCLCAFFLCVESKLPRIGFVEKISELTLEMYLTQFVIINAFVGVQFPANIVIVMCAILGNAFILHSVSSFVIDKVAALKKREQR